MSKFCSNCGKALEDAARFCDGCGAAQAAQETAAPQQPTYQPPAFQQSPYYQPPHQANYQPSQQPVYQAPVQQPTQQPVYQAPVQQPTQQPVQQPATGEDKKGFDFAKFWGDVKSVAKGTINRCKKDKPFMYKCLGIVGGALVLIILLILLLGGGHGGKTAPLDYALDIAKGDFEQLEYMYPPEYWDYMEKERGITLEDTIEELSENAGFLSSVDYDISYEVLEEKELSSKDLKGIAKELSQTYNMNQDKFTAAWELEVETTISFGGMEQTDTSPITVIEYDGNWYGIDWRKYGDFYSASFSGIDS